MKAVHTTIAASSLLLILLCMGAGQVASPLTPATRLLPSPTQTALPGPSTLAPTPTSIVAERVNQRMICADTFQLTVTMVTHLSNALQLTIVVENVTDRAAVWHASAEIQDVYILDGNERLGPIDHYGCLAKDGSIEAGGSDTGWLVVPLPIHESFRLYYPDCEPAYLELQRP